MDDLMTSQPIGGFLFQNFEMLDAKIDSALRTIARFKESASFFASLVGTPPGMSSRTCSRREAC